jgi:addiction module HigA family antidote
MQMANPLHPGEIIRELYLKPLGLTVTEAAKGLGISRNTLSDLLNGKHGISAEMAYRLAKAFGSTPESWLNLQTIYDLAQVREKAEALEVRQFFAPQPVAP